MRTQRIANRLRWIAPLHAGVQPFRVLSEDHDIDLGLLEAAGGFLADEVQRIAGERQARPHADVEIELLPHGDDRAEVLIAFALQRRAQFGLRFFLWLGGDGAEEADLVRAQQIDGALGKGIAFLDPALPPDVGVYVLGFEADGVEHADRLGQHLIADPISGHGYDGMFCHESSLLNQS